MKVAPISAKCPHCGSGDVIYSCKPECCFNHVCNNCYTTFELATTRVGEVSEDLEITVEPDSSAPTAPCARCGEPRVFAIEEPAAATRFVCAACRALLTLTYTEIAPA